MRVLVTGGAGYIGSVLVPMLIEAHKSVTVLDNFMYRQSPLNQLCCNTHFDVVRGDVRDIGLMRKLVAEADVVIPLAAIVGAPACDAAPNAAVEINHHAIATLVDLMSPAQQLLIPITNSGYGIGEPGVECTEETPIRPISHYGRTKMAAEAIAMSRENTTSFRLATVFGMSPRMRLDLLVNDFVYRAVNDRAIVLFEPHFKRNFIHVRDVAGVFLGAIHGHIPPGVYNVGLSDANLSKLELCQKIAEQLPEFSFLEAPIGTDPDKRDYIVSNAKIEALGFKAGVSLPAGITELIKGYRMLRSGAPGNV